MTSVSIVMPAFNEAGAIEQHVHDLEPLVGPAPLAPSIMVTLGAVARRWRVIETPVRHLPRARGSSSLRSLRLVSFSLRGLRELIAFHKEVRQQPERAALVVHEVL